MMVASRHSMENLFTTSHQEGQLTREISLHFGVKILQTTHVVIPCSWTDILKGLQKAKLMLLSQDLMVPFTCSQKEVSGAMIP